MGNGTNPRDDEPLFQIGEAAERIGLSIRTIRHYEDAGLIVPSARSAGRFRLYAEADLQRLLLVKDMKPLGFSLDEMRELLELLDKLAAPKLSATRRRSLHGQLIQWREEARRRVSVLEAQILAASRFAARLDFEVVNQE